MGVSSQGAIPDISQSVLSSASSGSAMLVPVESVFAETSSTSKDVDSSFSTSGSAILLAADKVSAAILSASKDLDSGFSLSGVDMSSGLNTWYTGNGFSDLKVDVKASSVDFMSAIQVIECGIAGGKCKFAGRLMMCDETPRTIQNRRELQGSPKKEPLGSPRKSSKVESLALDMVMLDKTGLVAVTLFGTDRVTKIFASKTK